MNMSYVTDLRASLLYFNNEFNEFRKKDKSLEDLSVKDISAMTNKRKMTIYKSGDEEDIKTELQKLSEASNTLRELVRAGTLVYYTYGDYTNFEIETLKVLNPVEYQKYLQRKDAVDKRAQQVKQQEELNRRIKGPEEEIKIKDRTNSIETARKYYENKIKNGKDLKDLMEVLNAQLEEDLVLYRLNSSHKFIPNIPVEYIDDYQDLAGGLTIPGQYLKESGIMRGWVTQWKTGRNDAIHYPIGSTEAYERTSITFVNNRFLKITLNKLKR